MFDSFTRRVPCFIFGVRAALTMLGQLLSISEYRLASWDSCQSQHLSSTIRRFETGGIAPMSIRLARQERDKSLHRIDLHKIPASSTIIRLDNLASISGRQHRVMPLRALRWRPPTGTASSPQTRICRLILLDNYAMWGSSSFQGHPFRAAWSGCPWPTIMR